MMPVPRPGLVAAGPVHRHETRIFHHVDRAYANKGFVLDDKHDGLFHIWSMSV
jgi:hypothetical protein